MASAGIEYPDILRRWEKAPQEFRDNLQKRWGTYISYLVQYVKREKLSGQVLCKYQNVFDAVGGQAKWRHKPGSLKKTFGAQVYNNIEAQFFETIYGRAWEFGFSRKQYDVAPSASRGLRARLMFYAGGRWRFAKKVTIKAQTFPAKPHITPSVKETADRFGTLIFRPLMKFLQGGTGE